MSAGRLAVTALCMRNLFFVMLAGAILVPKPAGAASISTVYDMDRMLSEPHPMANEYGTRWTAPPSSGTAARPRTSMQPASRPLAPLPPRPPGLPSASRMSSGPLPETAKPTLPPAAGPKPVVRPGSATGSAPGTAVAVPEFKLTPRLSLDTGGLDVDVVKTAPPPLPPTMPDPGKK